MLSFAIEKYVSEEMLAYLSERSVVNQPEFQREFGLTDDESQAIFKVLYEYHILADDNTVNEQLFHPKHLSEEDIQYYCSKLKLCNLSFLLFIQAIPRSIDIYKDGEIPEGLRNLEELGLAYLWNDVYFSYLDFESTRNLGNAFMEHYRSMYKGKRKSDSDKTHLMVIERFLNSYNKKQR